MEMHRTKSSQRYFEEENKAWNVNYQISRCFIKQQELKQCDTHTSIDKLLDLRKETRNRPTTYKQLPVYDRDDTVIQQKKK